MDPPLIDRVYECSLVPELWPDVLHEVGRIAEAGASLFMTNADVISWTCPRSHRTICERRLVWRGQVVARLFAARHAGFLTDLDVLTLEELDQEPIYRDMWRPRGTGWAGGHGDSDPYGRKTDPSLDTANRTRTGGTRHRPKTRGRFAGNLPESAAICHRHRHPFQPKIRQANQYRRRDGRDGFAAFGTKANRIASQTEKGGRERGGS